MSTSNVDNATVSIDAGRMTIAMAGGLEFSFPIALNPRLAAGSPSQLANVRVSPFGIHWPELDEDLSFDGLARGDFGQCTAEPVVACVAEEAAHYGE